MGFPPLVKAAVVKTVIVDQVYATRKAKNHMLSKHGVEWHEVREVMLQQGLQPRRARTVRGERRYCVTGRTETGRELVVFFAIEGRRARVITARPPKRS